jgi:hypothetical protein
VEHRHRIPFQQRDTADRDFTAGKVHGHGFTGIERKCMSHYIIADKIQYSLNMHLRSNGFDILRSRHFTRIIEEENILVPGIIRVNRIKKSRKINTRPYDTERIAGI